MLPRRTALAVFACLTILIVLSAASNLGGGSAAGVGMWANLFAVTPSSSSSTPAAPDASARHEASQEPPTSTTKPLRVDQHAASGDLSSISSDVIDTHRTFFPAAFLHSDDAAGQVWEFSTVSSPSLGAMHQQQATALTPRSRVKTAPEILAEYKACTGTGNVHAGASRINSLSEVLSGIRIVKFMCWEDAFVTRISDKREVEPGVWSPVISYRN